MQQKINIQQLSREISLRNDCSQSTSDQFLKELFAIVAEELKNSKNVTIAGLGEFKRDKDGQNVVDFIVDKALIEQLNQPFSCFEPIELADDISDEDLFEKTDEFSSDEPTESIYLDGEEVADLVEDDLSVVESDANNEQKESEELTLELDDVEDNTCKKSNEDKKVVEESLDVTTTQGSVMECEDYISDRQPSYKYKIVVFFVIGVLLGFVAGYITKDVLFNSVKSGPKIISGSKLHEVQMPNDVVPTGSSIQPVEFEEKIAVDTVEVVVDKVTSTRYLTTMARHYYGDINFWVYIYEENSDKLGSPNKIKPGTEVVIPPKEKYNINVLDTLSIKIAKEKAKEIYAKYR